MKRLAAIACLITLLLLFPVTLGFAGEKPVPPIDPLSLDQLPEFTISQGEVIFQRYCVFCHGESGRGDGLNASLLATPPRDLGNQAFLADNSDGDLSRIILKGGKVVGKSPAMPSFGLTITPDHAEMVVSYIRGELAHSGEEEGEDQDEPEL